MKEKYSVTGMSCAACSARVERSVAALDGIESVEVNLLANSMTCQFDENVVREKDIFEAVKKAGFGIGKEKKAYDRGEEKSLKRRFIISACFMIPLFYISMGHMMGWPMPEMSSLLVHIISGALAAPVIAVNRKYYINGFSNLAKRSPDMDSLIAVGSTASILLLYFESAAMILTLVTLGKYLEAVSKGKTGDAIRALMELAPDEAPVITYDADGKKTEKKIKSSEIKTGDILAVRPGERVPADGVIVAGETAIDESVITGESIPADRKKGDMVVCATVNQLGYFEMEVIKTGKDTTLSKIIELVEEASSGKAPIGRLADKISGIFVPVVIGIALVTAILWLISGQSGAFAVTRGIAVLVISCPCALGLATPVAIMTGTGRGASSGILVKSAQTLEMLGLIDTVVFDKTGTLTEGKPAVTDILSDKEDFLKYAASLEAGSEHPLGKAVVKEASDRGIKPEEAKAFRAWTGRGVSGEICGKTRYAGSIKFMEEMELALTEEQAKEGQRLQSEGKTLILEGCEGRVDGIIALADKVRAESREAVDVLKKMGIEVVLLTGDNKATAENIGSGLGIDNVVAQVMPGEKESEIRKLQAQGKRVLMAGDGINDAPAITRADVGAAVGTGTDIAIESADIVIAGNDVRNVGAAIKLGKAVLRNIKENLFWAFIYNVIGIPLAAGILYPIWGIVLNPMIAAACMSMSSVCVVTNALRLRQKAIK